MTALKALIEQRARLLLALGNTSRTVEFEDRRIEHFSPDELLTALSGLDRQISAISGQQESRLFTVGSSSGLIGNDHCSGGDGFEAWR